MRISESKSMGTKYYQENQLKKKSKKKKKKKIDNNKHILNNEKDYKNSRIINNANKIEEINVNKNDTCDNIIHKEDNDLNKDLLENNKYNLKNILLNKDKSDNSSVNKLSNNEEKKYHSNDNHSNDNHCKEYICDECNDIESLNYEEERHFCNVCFSFLYYKKYCFYELLRIYKSFCFLSDEEKSLLTESIYCKLYKMYLSVLNNYFFILNILLPQISTNIIIHLLAFTFHKDDNDTTEEYIVNEIIDNLTVEEKEKVDKIYNYHNFDARLLCKDDAIIILNEIKSKLPYNENDKHIFEMLDLKNEKSISDNSEGDNHLNGQHLTENKNDNNNNYLCNENNKNINDKKQNYRYEEKRLDLNEKHNNTMQNDCNDNLKKRINNDEKKENDILNDKKNSNLCNKKNNVSIYNEDKEFTIKDELSDCTHINLKNENKKSKNDMNSIELNNELYEPKTSNISNVSNVNTDEMLNEISNKNINEISNEVNDHLKINEKQNMNISVSEDYSKYEHIPPGLRITNTYTPSLDDYSLIQNMSKVRSTLRQFVRDWSYEGKNERENAYDPILRSLDKYLPITDNYVPKILCPGSGLGRLPYEVAKKGYRSQGNEFSYFMLLASNYILNYYNEKNSLNIQPYCLSTSNRKNRDDHLKIIQLPDVNTYNKVVLNTEFSMCAGELIEVYYNEKEQFDGVLTCFFLDTAKNVFMYIRTFANILKPNSLWSNIGPLLYHYAEMPNEMSIELSWDEIKLIISKWFSFLEIKWIDNYYTTNFDSMMQVQYHCIFFSALRNNVPVDD
ncbi:N2227-like protein, putative [Plasmodium gallinaceum]|uniref:carnosine N-methyltransferase n=1 Tax=Plasmodium gallinaceum TaxID=5849 RepID=A0A1J1GSU0_PLAGA|nr:N2227-like protein, putative [Plasmodium gallinaceum]CRG95320.1 N2227-like protein, putative [Plasmodium gallinaceum]